MTKEWSIRDEATGEWWSGDYKHPWVTDGAKRYAVYGIAATQCPGLDGTSPSYYRATARIVEAPAKPMTDAECVAWLESVTLIVAGDGSSGINGIRFIPHYDALGRRCERGSWHVKHQDGSSAACAEGFFDAIRAAAKKIGA